MMTALIGALFALLLGGGEVSFDLTEPSEFRKTEQILMDVIEDSEREKEVLEVIAELRDLEKEAMKSLNKNYEDLYDKEWDFDADLNAWQIAFDDVAAGYRKDRWTMTELLGKWKGLMTEEEWTRYLQESGKK